MLLWRIGLDKGLHRTRGWLGNGLSQPLVHSTPSPNPTPFPNHCKRKLVQQFWRQWDRDNGPHWSRG